MNEFEDKLNAILSNPEEMEKISRLAAELMGGAEPPAKEAQAADGELLGRLAGLMGTAGRGGGSKRALLQALAPYLRPDRQEKLRKSLRLAQVLRLAGAALEERGGDGHV